MNIEQQVQSVLREHGIHTPAVVEEGVRKPSFEAVTNLRTGQQIIRCDPTFQPSKVGKRFSNRKGISSPLEACVRDVTSHECGHIRNTKRIACPETVEDHEEFFYEPIAIVLKKNRKLGNLDSVTNLCEDLIDNTLLCQDMHGGLSLFYDNVATTIGWDPAYEAYMRIQLYCWGDTADKQLLVRHFTNNVAVIKSAQTFLRIIERESGKRNRLSLEEAAKYLSEKSHWKTVATAFAEAIAPLLKNQMDISMCGYGRMIQQEMKDPSRRERFARRYYEGNKRIPHWMKKEEALDAVYSALARQIEIKVEEPRKAKDLPVVPYRYVPFDPEEHDVRAINFRKPLIVPKSETQFGLEGVTFGVAEEYITLPLMVKQGIRNFPPFKYSYIDCSESMRDGLPDANERGSTTFIPWGDKSKYHYVCRTWYDIIEYLAQQHILPNITVTLGTFSTTSRVCRGLEEAKKLLFHPKFDDTNMDQNTIDNFCSGDKSVFFTVSDGHVQNWNEVKDAFIARAMDQYYFHIQLGNETAMTRNLLSAGLPVYTIHKGEDLERLAIDLTRNAYQKHIDETLARLQ